MRSHFHQTVVGSIGIIFGGAAAQAQCGAWDTRLGTAATGMDNAVDSLGTWDPDGVGPLAPQLVAGGMFTKVGTTTINRIARWDGSAWQPLGSGITGAGNFVASILEWDPDGAGPLTPRLVAAGQFLTAGGVSAKDIASWNGTAWQAFGTGMNSQINALAMWDPDGSGPLPEQIVAGGAFTTAGGASISRISRWDGSAWQPLGAGISGGTLPSVGAMLTWDPDGAGPSPEVLVVTGNFTTAGAVAANNVAQWDGSAWQALGTGLGGPSPRGYSLALWDPDGTGPLGDQVFVGGGFTTAGGVPAVNIARWDGSAWSAVGGINSTVFAIAAWDPDGSGPSAKVLVAGGGFTIAGGSPRNYIARWNGLGWQAFGTGLNNWGRAILNWDAGEPANSAPQLLVGGDFTDAGGASAGRLAMWNTLGPTITAHPSDIVLCSNSPALFSVSADGAGITYRWRRGGVDLTDGPTGTGSTITGSATAMLTITAASSADNATYDAVVSNACAASASNAATLSVCTADFDCDGFLTGDDFDDYVEAFANGDAPADFDGDGFVTGDDFDLYVLNFELGC